MPFNHEHLTVLLLHFSFLALSTFHFGICTQCISSEREFLLTFRQHLIDPTNRLSSWNVSNTNCCNWVGVICSDITSHVLQLHLNNLLPYFPNKYPTYQYKEAHEAYEKSKFSGKINSSLVELKHLNHLDLSGHNFGDVEILISFGS